MSAPKRYPAGPWRAAQTAKQPQATARDEAHRLVNCYAQDTESGPVIVGVPGFALLGAATPTTGATLGSGGNDPIQFVGQLTKRDGTEYTVAVCDGEIYTYNWSTDVWTKVVTAANLVTASITVSATARIYAVTFADLLIFSDGTNVPFGWDGTSGAGGLTEYTNAPALFGQPVVYYGKLFGIKATARQTIVWSEEGDPATGYEAGGYTNAWDLVQTETEGLVALAATNDALYYLRQNSISAILGAVTDDFQTAGTRAGIASGIGTLAPASVVVVGDDVCFVDQYGAFQKARVGAGSREIGLGARELMRDTSPTARNLIQAVHDVEAGHVRFLIPESGQSVGSMEIRLDDQTGRLACQQTGYKAERLGLVKNGSGVPTVAHGGGGDALSSAEGLVYAHGHPDGDTWNYGFLDGAAAVHHQGETEHIANDPRLEKIFTRGVYSVQPVTTLSGMTLTLTTPTRTESLELSTVTASGTPLGVFVLGTDTLGGIGRETTRQWGMKARGRWLIVGWSHAALNERLALNYLAVDASAVSQKAGVR